MSNTRVIWLGNYGSTYTRIHGWALEDHHMFYKQNTFYQIVKIKLLEETFSNM